MHDLTDRQQQVLTYIRAAIAERGYPPTMREIGAHMGIRSTNGVADHLRALERKGYITREDMKSRSIRPLLGVTVAPALDPAVAIDLRAYCEATDTAHSDVANAAIRKHLDALIAAGTGEQRGAFFALQKRFLADAPKG